MKFEDLLDVLESETQLSITVTNERGDKVCEGTVEHFREEKLLLDLRVDKMYTTVTGEIEQTDYYPPTRMVLTFTYHVTLYDGE